jgi:hypothetical protein
MKKFITALVLASSLAFSACGGDNASTVNDNIKKEADKFKVVRSVTVTNGITDKVEYYVEGRCAFFDLGRRIDVLCKELPGDAPSSFRKATIKLGDQDSAVVTQLREVNVSEYRTKIIIRPTSIVPDLDLVTGNQKPSTP